MVLFPNCKINLGLNIIGKRSDGYHDLETIFYPIPLFDAIEVIESSNPGKSLHFSMSGEPIEGTGEQNICVKAYELLKADFPRLARITFHLHKSIPTGAGLGGGSADGAFMLKLLNKKFELKLTTGQLLDYSLQLGSDCPFFIVNKPCFARGRGEILEPIEVDLSRYKIIVINPRIHVPTAEAFLLATPAAPSHSLKEIVKQPIDTWKEQLRNDFEEPVFNKHPEIKMLKDQLYEAGAIYSSMTGSGSTIYGLFEKNKDPKLNFPSSYFVRELDDHVQ